MTTLYALFFCYYGPGAYCQLDQGPWTEREPCLRMERLYEGEVSRFPRYKDSREECREVQVPAWTRVR